MNSNSESPSYSSKDVREVTGLTSRQLNDWDERGALPHERNGKEGWRRFSDRDIFALMVCSEFRRNLGVPVERLKFVKEVMTQDGANHLSAAIHLMGVLGVGVWVMTDFEDTFVMDSELEFRGMWQAGYFGSSNDRAFAFVNVTPLVNKMLSALKEKKPDPKTLLQLFTEDHPELLSDQFCGCHRLQICPTAWMNPDGANEGSPLVAEMRLDLEDLE